jgi:NAD-dependent dihydropyrimidine dehydrogenase PreA subunit
VFVIAEPCVDHTDQACVAACPVDCISADPAFDRKFYIDPRGCIDCGACESACPNQAIYRADQLPVEWAAYAWVDAAWYVDPEAARGTLDAWLPAA